MDDKELREQIAMYTDTKGHVDNILALIKEAGYYKPSPASVEEIANKVGALVCGTYKWQEIKRDTSTFEDGEYWNTLVYNCANEILAEIRTRQLLLLLISHKELTVLSEEEIKYIIHTLGYSMYGSHKEVGYAVAQAQLAHDRTIRGE